MPASALPDAVPTAVMTYCCVSPATVKMSPIATAPLRDVASTLTVLSPTVYDASFTKASIPVPSVSVPQVCVGTLWFTCQVAPKTLPIWPVRIVVSSPRVLAACTWLSPMRLPSAAGSSTTFHGPSGDSWSIRSLRAPDPVHAARLEANGVVPNVPEAA